MRLKQRHLVTTLVAALSLNAHAETDPVGTATPTSTTLTTSMRPAAGSSNQRARLTSKYATWAGSTENARSLVTGLRTGTPITLQATLPTSGLADTVTFTPQTQDMGWGNVTKAISLAQADLAAAGITNPTPQQLQIVLTGGDLTTTQGTSTHMDGILAMRSQGMGWGQIAHKLDLQPGATFKPAGMETGGTGKLDQEYLASYSDRETRQNALHTTHAPISRIVTASGVPISSHASFSHTEHGSGHVAAQRVSHITTASGSGMGASGGHGSSNGNAFGRGKN